MERGLILESRAQLILNGTMESIDSPITQKSPSMGSTLFWGALSIFFACLTYYYFTRSQEGGRAMRLLQDQQTLLRQQNSSLRNEVEKLQLRLDASRLKSKDETSSNTSLTSLATDPSVQPMLEALIKVCSELSPSGEMKVRVDRDGLVMVIPSGLLFVPGTATELRPNGKSLLLRCLGAAQSVGSGWNLRIEAHTDSDPSAAISAWDLTSARALAVLRVAMSEGRWPARSLGSLAWGDAHPLIATDARESRGVNRRIELRLSPPEGPTSNRER